MDPKEKDKDKQAARPERATVPQFEVYTQAPNYSGVHPCRLRFEWGVGHTSAVRQACQCRELGLFVVQVNDAPLPDGVEPFGNARDGQRFRADRAKAAADAAKK